MPTELPDLDALLERDSLLDQLAQVNARLLLLSASDVAEWGQAIELRAHLLGRAGHLLRSTVNPTVLEEYRVALEQAVNAGDVAVRRLLSLRQTISSKYQGLSWLQSECQADSGIVCRM